MHMLRTWCDFRHFKRSNRMEGSGLQILATFLSAIEAI